MEDHVHLLIQIPATLALAKAVNTLNFETEFLALLKKHNVEFDPKFVFG